MPGERRKGVRVCASSNYNDGPWNQSWLRRLETMGERWEGPRIEGPGESGPVAVGVLEAVSRKGRRWC